MFNNRFGRNLFLHNLDNLQVISFHMAVKCLLRNGWSFFKLQIYMHSWDGVWFYMVVDYSNNICFQLSPKYQHKKDTKGVSTFFLQNTSHHHLLVCKLFLALFRVFFTKDLIWFWSMNFSLNCILSNYKVMQNLIISISIAKVLIGI